MTFIPYEVYKIIHLTSLMIMFCSFTVALIGEKKIKLFNILAGVSTLLILVSGMGLLPNVGITHGAAWPIWVKLKVFFWALVGIGVPVVIKRTTGLNKVAFWVMIVIYAVVVAAVNYKF
jgi:hypothetical protein